MKIGIDLGGSHISVGIVNNEGKVICKKEKDFGKEDRKNIEKAIIEIITSYINEIAKQEKINMIGIASPGTNRDGIIVRAENLGIYNFNITEELKKFFKESIIKLSNDATCAAICEKKYGAMKEYFDCVFLCLGTGIGGAVFLNNKLLQAKRFEGFELGHVVIQKNGKECSCGGNGCFEKYCSMKALKEKVAKNMKLNDVTGKELHKILKSHTEEIEKIIDEYIEYLRIGIINYINIFEPEIICLGGSFVYYKDILLDRLIKKIKQENTTFNKEVPEIVVAHYENDAGIIGATLL